MRLHRLEIAAFGPFRTRQLIDFDRLSTSGVFLLHGSTGAGKTSVLDAVCFALYGKVPGARAGSAPLRSHYAEGDERPEVVLEFSVGPRRFEVTRSPSWERPKRRGSGTTTAQTRVVVREYRDGEWSTRSTRVDESAHLLDDVLGMGSEAFTKLVVLPQGEFAAFLRADAETRRTLLERIFGTDRFTAVQDWLRERRSALRADLDGLDRITHTLLARAEQAAAPALRPAPAPADPTTGAPAVDEPGTSAPEVLSRLAQLTVAVGQAREASLTDQLEAARAVDHAGVLNDQAQAMAQLADQFASLVGRQQTAEHRQHGIDRLQERIERARRARGLAALAPARAAALARHRAATEACRAGEETLGGGGPAADPAAERDQVSAGLALLATLQPVVEEHERLTAQGRDLDEAIRRAQQGRARLGGELDRAEEEVTRVERAESEARAQAATLAGDRLALAAARQQAEAARERERIGAELAAVRGRHDAARAAAATARERYLDVRERRLDGLAAELAGTLHEGAPCRVCGSLAHPRPARPGADPVDAAQEQDAHRAAEAARDAAAALAGEQAALEATLTAVTGQAGGLAVADADEALIRCRERLDLAERAADLVPELAGELAEARQRRESAGQEAAHLDDQVHVLRQRRETITVQLLGLDERLAEARDGYPSLAARRGALTDRRAALHAAEAAREELARAAEHLAEVDRAAGAAAREAGFADADEAFGAVLDQTALAGMERQVIEHQVEVESVEEQLTDERFTVLHEGTCPVLEAPRLAALADDLEQARLREQQAVRRAGVCDSAFADLDRLQAELADHLAVAAPVRERFEALDDLARCADGTGGDNALRMSLSAFVLTARLEQVAAAATLRLGQMSSGRYALVHTDSAERGRGRAGLTLEVVDAWTGARRSTGSLSGGEAFYTSLALALGLADVVAEEAGGVHLDTLFIDEGFGSLDEDTLDEVMDALDCLRSGGRSVGVVSHLAELRQRISTRLEVTKSARGSTVTLAS